MERKPVRWTGDSRKQLREFPEAVRFEIGQALYQAEIGERHPSPRRDLELIRRRFADAELHFSAMIEREE